MTRVVRRSGRWIERHAIDPDVSEQDESEDPEPDGGGLARPAETMTEREEPT